MYEIFFAWLGPEHSIQNNEIVIKQNANKENGKIGKRDEKRANEWVKGKKRGKKQVRIPWQSNFISAWIVAICSGFFFYQRFSIIKWILSWIFSVGQSCALHSFTHFVDHSACFLSTNTFVIFFAVFVFACGLSTYTHKSTHHRNKRARSGERATERTGWIQNGIEKKKRTFEYRFVGTRTKMTSSTQTLQQGTGKKNKLS